MVYVKNTWNTGDVITATKLNNIENGIATVTEGTLLWTNEAPESEYAAASITLETSEYSTLVFVFSSYKTEVTRTTQTIRFEKQFSYTHGENGAIITAELGNYVREITATDTSLSISDCIDFTDNTTINNTLLVPYKILGYV